ncbi:MAG: MarR family winged helix-turn-helix transcriptional regulator [Ramlibacter sp.]
MPTVAAPSEPLPAMAAVASGSPEKQVLRRFRVVFNAVKTHFQQVEKQAGIGGAQVWALSVVQQHPGIRVSALATAMDIHQSTASNLVRQLVERALVEALRSDADRRAVQLHLLPAGQSILARAPGPFSGVLPAALERLDSATLTRLNHDLGQLIAALEAHNGADPQAEKIPLASL